jgi:plastocyanin
VGGGELLEDRTLLATVTVHIFNFDFSTNPSGQPIVDPTINVGDTIHWVWDEGFHSTTSVAAIAESWNSGNHSVGFTYDHKFTHAGSFAYYCMVHGFDNGNGTAGGMSGTITVNAPTLLSIAVTPTNPSVPKGETEQFTATGTYSDNSTQDLTSQVTWASATPSVATITTTGLASAVSLGSSSISATLANISGSTTLTVSAPVLQSIAVTPANPSVPKGLAQQFTATGTLSDNTTTDLTSQVTWASASTTVASINTAGLASTLKVGTSSISATLGNISGSTTLTVTAPIVQSIAVTPANPSVPKGETQQFTATGTLTDGTTQNVTSQVTWASATTTVATISAAGLATARGTGTSSISASLGGISGSTVLTVTPPVLQSIAVAPANPNVPKGKSEQFTATGTLSDASTQDLTSQVTWASATPAVATISSAGLATTLTTGTSSISATLSGLSGSTVLTVTPPVLQSIVVTPANPSIAPGTTVQFSAMGILTDNTTEDVNGQVTWRSATTSIATIAASGLATAVAHGTSSISATIGTVVGSTVLTVKNVTISSIAVTPANPSVPKGETQAFAATGTFSDNSTQDITNVVTWASATPAVASITAAGVASTLAVGTSSIGATFETKTGSTTLTVTPPVALAIAVTPVNPTVPKGATQQFTATGTYSDQSTQDVTSQVTWASATPSVATISGAGLATTLIVGTSKISATLGSLSDSTTLTVTPGVLISVNVTPANPSVPKGKTQQFTATGTFSDHSTEDLTSTVTWQSATIAVATISAAGLASSLTIGASSISATLGSISGSTNLTVTAPVVQSIAVTPANPSVPNGLTKQFTATGTLSDNSTQDLTTQVTWASATPTVATISTGGLASTLQVGTSSISATLGTVSGSTTLTATAPVIQSIAVTPANPSVPNGLTQQFTATGTYTDNSTKDVTNQVTWASATLGVATISTSGLASTVATGTSSISATLGTVSGSAVLTVAAPIIESIGITPVNPSLAKGLAQQFTATGTFSDNSTQDVTNQVTWSSATPGVATISTGGLASTLATGTSTISATLGAVTGSTTLTVTPPVVQSIAVTPNNPSIPKGDAQQFSATGTLTDGTTQDISGQVAWASTAPTVAAVSTSGLAHALTTGTSSISATLGNVSGSTILTVSPAVLVSIAVTPANSSVADGLTEQFTATGTFSDNTTHDETGLAVWASATPAVATVSHIGLGSTLSPGTSSISATIGNIVGSTVLTVTNVALESIVVAPTNGSLPKGETQQFTATGMFSNNTTQDLTSQVMWSVDTPAVASISADGLASAITPGTTMVMAMLGVVMGFTNLTVAPAVLQSITVRPANPSVPKGESQQLTAVGTYSDNSTSDLTGQVVWASGSLTAASVSHTGLFHALTTGTVSIRAALGQITGTTPVTVTPAILVSMAVTPANPNIAKGETQQLTATGTYSDDSTKDLTSQVTWSSATPSVASVSNTGLVNASNTGASSISAKLGAMVGAASVTVIPAILVKLTVSASAASLTAGTTEQFSATGTFSDHTTKDLTGQVTWTSAIPSVATISGSGLASGSSAGTTNVTATLGGTSGSFPLTITGVPIPPNPQFAASGVAIRARAHRRFSGTVANFKDPHSKAHDFLASIDWGDHSATTPGQIRAHGKDRFIVAGVHSYSQRGTFQVTITIRDSVGRLISAISHVHVAK